MNEQVNQVDGKFYKEANIVMLSTNIINKNQIVYNGIRNYIWIHDGESDLMKSTTGQHLYTLSSEEIKEGDWFYDSIFKQIMKCSKVGSLGIIYSDEASINFASNDQLDRIYKIIVSTDESLGLPRFSNDFLKKYCELGGIDKVLIEYVEIMEIGLDTIEYRTGKYVLKVAPDYTVSIKPFKVKDSWTEDEVVNFTANMISQYKQGNTNIENSNLIRKNLLSK